MTGVTGRVEPLLIYISFEYDNNYSCCCLRVTFRPEFFLEVGGQHHQIFYSFIFFIFFSFFIEMIDVNIVD